MQSTKPKSLNSAILLNEINASCYNQYYQKQRGEYKAKKISSVRKSKYGESKSSYRPVVDYGEWLDHS